MLSVINFSGSFASAVKVLLRVLALKGDEDPILRYEIGRLQLLMNRFCEAIESFEFGFRKDPNYLPILLGLAEAFYKSAFAHLDQGRFVRAGDEFCESARFAIEAIVKISK